MYPRTPAKYVFIFMTLREVWMSCLRKQEVYHVPLSKYTVWESTCTQDSKNRSLSTAVHCRHMWGSFSCEGVAFLKVVFSAVSLLEWISLHRIAFWLSLLFYTSAEYDYFKYHPMEEVGKNMPVISEGHMKKQHEELSEALTMLSTSDQGLDGAHSKEPLWHRDHHGLWNDLWNESHQLT